MSEQIRALEDWAHSIREDVETLKDVLESASAEEETRRFAAAGLNYMVSRMDLIPDWEPTIGVLDDVMVIRVCAGQALQASGDGLSDDVSIGLGRLANQDELVQDYLGSELYGKLRAHCINLVDQVVRGRSPAKLVDDDKAREMLFQDLNDATGKIPAVDCSDPDDIDVKLKAYLGHKL